MAAHILTLIFETRRLLSDPPACRNHKEAKTVNSPIAGTDVVRQTQSGPSGLTRQLPLHQLLTALRVEKQYVVALAGRREELPDRRHLHQALSAIVLYTLNLLPQLEGLIVVRAQRSFQTQMMPVQANRVHISPDFIRIYLRQHVPVKISGLRQPFQNGYGGMSRLVTDLRRLRCGRHRVSRL